MVGEFDGDGGVLKADVEQVAFANAALIWHATRQIYASDDGFSYIRPDGEIRRGSDLNKDLRAEYKSI